MTKWLTQLGPYAVERKEILRPSGQAYLALDAEPSFCVHTTEGDTVDGAWNTLAGKYAAPHFIIGQGRVVQCRPLTVQGAALRAHNDRFWQVEMVGHAQRALWTPPQSSYGPLVALTRYLHGQEGLPLYRPPEWPDKLDDGVVWAANNPRRQDGFALKRRGVYGHVDVPDQAPTWHWDPGSLRYKVLFADVEAIITHEEQEADDMKFQEWRSGWSAHEAGEALNVEWPPIKQEGWKDRNRLFNDAALKYAPTGHRHVHQHRVPGQLTTGAISDPQPVNAT